MAMMQISPEQGAFMTLLTRLVGATQAVEVGTFTGYSALCIARGLPDDGRLLCCDVSEEWTAIGRRAWDDAGVADQIELVIAPAVDTLRALPNERVPRPRVHRRRQAELPRVLRGDRCTRLRPNGVILVDNVLWGGRIVDPDADDENRGRDPRLQRPGRRRRPRRQPRMLTLGDGLTLLRKR